MHLSFRRAIVAFVILICAAVSARAQIAAKTPEQALSFERSLRISDRNFYRTPVTLPLGKSGSLIRSQVTTGYTLPPGARAIRILYHSQNATGGDVAASGVVLIPSGKAPRGGWPVIAWAHGTSGVAQLCAPSMMKDVYYGNEGLYAMVRAGFAVVATDYAGLGTSGEHQYIDKIAQAHDVINAVIAARSAIPTLGLRWIVDGHSQGGGASWGVAEQEAASGGQGFLGAVVVAGTINPSLLYPSVAANAAENFYIVYTAYAVKARFPEFNLSDMLTESALRYYKPLTTQGCWFYGQALSDQRALGNAVKSGWQQNKWVQRFIVENSVLKAPVKGPLLVLAGEADNSVPLRSIRQVVEEACARHLPLEYRSYPGLDHDPLMEKSASDQISWIKDRFAGKPAPGNCDKLDGQH